MSEKKEKKRQWYDVVIAIIVLLWVIAQVGPGY